VKDSIVINGVIQLVFIAVVLACSDNADKEKEDGDTGEPIPASTTSRNFGIHCTEDYESGWLATLTAGKEVCDGFANRADDEAIKEYYYDLKGQQYYWQTTGDANDNSLEDVDLFLALTHGGAWSTDYAEWGMWNNNTLATSQNMRLGDTTTGRRGLSILSTFSCHTLQTDSYFMNRWDSVFQGGLRIVTGSRDLIYIGYPDERYMGNDYAYYLNAGWTIAASWETAMDATAYNNMDAAVAATGINSADCSSRRDNMTWDNFQNYTRLRDNTIGYYCWRYWDDI
jgi:hypothetical protein